MIVDLLQSPGLSPLILGAVLVLTLVYFYVLLPSHPSDYPPIPVKPEPFFGHIRLMGKDHRKSLREWRKTTGDIFSAYIGNQLSVVLSGYDVIKEALVKHGDVFSARPLVYSMSCFRHPGGGVIQASGESWKEQRTISLSILRSFGMGKSILAEKIFEETQAFNDVLASLNGKPYDMKILTNKCVSNVICNIMFGKRFDLDDPVFERLMNKIQDFLIYQRKSFFLTPYPWLKYLPGDVFHGKKFAQTTADIEDILIEKFIEPLSQREQLDQVDCFITEYMKETFKRNDKGQATSMNKDNLSAVITDLFLAGTETTSTTTCWFVLLMLHHPNILKKIQDEINDVVGNERPPSMQDKTQLNYLNACIMETQRWISLVPFSVIHMCDQTVKFNGYTIPKGTLIRPSLDSILYDEKLWPEPHTFRPERFLDDKGHVKNFEEFVPFSLGRRACLGESLSKMEMYLFLSSLCQRFDLRPVEEGKLPSLDYVYGVAASPQLYEVRFIDRRK